MPDLTIYKLRFTSALHIGDEHEDYNISYQNIKSDTFYAALTAALAKVGYNVPVDGNLEFVLSSLFPFYQKDTVYETKAEFFLPNPLLQIIKPEWDRDFVKKVKKIKWIESAAYLQMIKNVEKFWCGIDAKMLKGPYLTLSDILDDFIKAELVPRVKVSRSNKDAEPFYMDRVYFKDASGLFFIAQGNTENLEKGLNILMHEGIGTDRNIGNGFFVWEKSSIDGFEVPKSNFVTNLSMFLPESQEQLNSMLNDNSIAYDFALRGGWITTPPYNSFRKNKINMFTEGSVFKYNDANGIINLGKIEDITPKALSLEHKIFRCGKALFLPILIN